MSTAVMPTQNDKVKPNTFNGRCFKCKGHGHASRDCTEFRRDGQGEKSLKVKREKHERRGFDGICYICNERGHRKSECPKLQKVGKGRKQSAHRRVSDVPREAEADESMVEDELKGFHGICYICKEQGHRKSDCPKRLEVGKEQQQSAKGRVLDVPRDAEVDKVMVEVIPNLGEKAGLKASENCYNCKDNDHLMKDCPKIQNDGHGQQQSAQARASTVVHRDVESLKAVVGGETVSEQLHMGTPSDKEYAAFEDKVRRTVYLDNLSTAVTAAVLKTALGQFGNVTDVQFIPNYNESQNIPLCALVEMDTTKQAMSIVSEMTNYPFMMSGMPRPARARAAEAEMFADRPRKPTRKIHCRWMDPKDPDFEVAKELKTLAKKHAAEASFLLKFQLEEEEKLAKQQGETLKANYKKYEMMDNLMADGTLSRLARRYDLRISDD